MMNCCSCLATPVIVSVPKYTYSLLNHTRQPLLLGFRVPSSNTFRCPAIVTSSSASSRRRGERMVVKSSNSSGEEAGVYGPWTIQPSDVQEVILYRSGLVTAASSLVVASSAIFLPCDWELAAFIRSNLDLLYACGASGLGLSLFLIHIYVTEIKRTLQAFWVLGVLGSAATYAKFAQPEGMHLVDYVLQNPAATWLVGPLFAALTGLVFKEGLCYGKLEAGILTFIIPTLLLGHLTGVVDAGTKTNLLVVWMALFTVFAGRKFFQPIKDDIGDKSVFMFNSLSEEEKRARIYQLEQQKQMNDELESS